jgi:hypothetical protein
MSNVRINDRGEITLAPLVDFRDPRTRLPKFPQVGRGANASGPPSRQERHAPLAPPAFLMKDLQSAPSSG